MYKALKAKNKGKYFQLEKRKNQTLPTTVQFLYRPKILKSKNVLKKSKTSNLILQFIKQESSVP
ncbi:hypothetical protein T05_12730 [Trichinella murrelli]|uniref:Uncharacterized protein n=1 Tax=Trichinella murrelli TaxID=144512 RepID=A0A0V0U3F8_9BILA|nr:hypothetical protein T05_12730 [Trichinella murrelli]